MTSFVGRAAITGAGRTVPAFTLELFVVCTFFIAMESIPVFTVLV